MKPSRKHIYSAAMIGGGMLVMALCAKPLAEHEALDFPVNALGINRSPFGEIFAMAMQGQVDVFFNQSIFGRPVRSDALEGERSGRAPSIPLGGRLFGFLARLESASMTRTNPHQNSPALNAHIRRQTEKKLRFAYQLDPAHYGNYAAYYFFLTEPGIGGRRIITPEAARLSQETIEYGLRESQDPRPSLTAAAALTNKIHLMFAERNAGHDTFSIAEKRESLELLDECIARHLEIRDQWIASGGDQLISQRRLDEMTDRLSFVRRIRDAAETAILRFEELKPKDGK